MLFCCFLPSTLVHASPASWVRTKLFSLTCCLHSRCSPGCSCPVSLQGHTADSCSPCPPGPPGPFLQSCSPAGQSAACAVTRGYSVPGAGLCIRPNWISWSSSQPIPLDSINVSHIITFAFCALASELSRQKCIFPIQIAQIFDVVRMCFVCKLTLK